MSRESELPDNVVAELKANRKVSAIKLLRAQRGIGLKESKQIIEAYMEQHLSNPRPKMPESETGIGRILILAIGVGVIYGIYKFLT